jgi:hypothetical protein
MRIRAVLVLRAVNRKRRAAHVRQFVVERPVAERGRQPRVDPGTQHPLGLVAVIPGEAVELPRCVELPGGVANAVQRATFHECLRGDRDQRPAASRMRGRARNRHPAAHAVPERDERVDAEPFQYRGEVVLGLIAHERRGELSWVTVRTAEAEPVVCNHVARSGTRELRGKSRQSSTQPSESCSSTIGAHACPAGCAPRQRLAKRRPYGVSIQLSSITMSVMGARVGGQSSA